MKITFNLWSADEIIQAYIEFIEKRNSKETFISYNSERFGLKETLEGRIDIDDRRLKSLSEKVQYLETMHELELSQKDWKIEFRLELVKDHDNDNMDSVELSFDDSLKKEVYNHFKKFEPIEIENQT